VPQQQLAKSKEQSPLAAFDSKSTPRFNRTLNFALFGTSVIWLIASRSVGEIAARGFSVRFSAAPSQELLSGLIFLFLLVLGFSVLQAISGHPAAVRDVMGLPNRPTAKEEWEIGAAIGWGGIVLAVLPMALGRTLHVHFLGGLHGFWLVLVNLATLLVAALAEEIAFRGYPFRRLIEAIGPVGATIALSILFGLVHAFNPDATWISVLITMLAGVLFSVAWLRTHALWLPWGMHFAWNASMGVLLGLPVSGLNSFSTVVMTRAVGRLWLTGGSYGPEAALCTVPALLISIIVLVLLTRDYAWDYTRPQIVSAGYAVEVAPPAAHTAMEQEVRAPSLVQILPTTSQTRSVMPGIPPAVAPDPGPLEDPK
jgi:membrane protease YdiL (CAAX protease family)